MSSVKNFIKDWVVPILIAVIIAALINQFLFFQISVPTSSMYPTIKPKDRIITTRIYNRSNIHRGDIIVFYSDELHETLVKRVIGLPKDKVEVREDGSVWLNGQKQEEPYVKNPGGKTGSFQVPEGEFLFLGDNRANSYDSRYWKEPYIPAKAIKGKARYIIFPFNRAAALK